MFGENLVKGAANAVLPNTRPDVVAIGQKVVSKKWILNQTLKYDIHETSVSHVVKPSDSCGNTRSSINVGANRSAIDTCCYFHGLSFSDGYLMSLEALLTPMMSHLHAMDDEPRLDTSTLVKLGS